MFKERNATFSRALTSCMCFNDDLFNVANIAYFFVHYYNETALADILKDNFLFNLNVYSYKCMYVPTRVLQAAS